MAKTTAYAVGFDAQGKRQSKQAYRAGDGAVMANAGTWHISATAWVNADGSGYITVARDGKTFHYCDAT